MRSLPAAPVLGLVVVLTAAPACAGDAPPGPGWTFSDAVTGLGQVTDVAFLPDGRMLIAEKQGALKLRGADGTVRVAARLPVDTESEKGLLGVAVDPAFATTHRVFLYYSASDEAGGTDLDRHRVVSAPLRDDGTLDTGAVTVLVRGLRGPANHDGGALEVGPDGRLYVGVGDTGCNSGAPPEPPGAPGNFFGTCLTNANGKILRVALDGTIPPDNPLAGAAATTACGATCRDAPTTATGAPRREIWAWGFRNPWRFSFDDRTGRLWVGDVGEVTWEEVTIAEKGRHHGWPWREGARGWPRSKCRETVPDAGDCVEPVYACRHGDASGGVDGGCKSITGGVLPDFASWPASHRGLYLFGDNANGRIWTLALTPGRDGVVAGSRREIGRVQGMPVAFALGPDDAVYVAVLPGRVVRIAPSR
jgi:glucose/arabinose dehydrogenase